MADATFTSPTMVARAALVRAIALLDEIERAQARGDAIAAARLAGAFHDHARAADDAAYRVWLAAVTVDTSQGYTISPTDPDGWSQAPQAPGGLLDGPEAQADAELLASIAGPGDDEDDDEDEGQDQAGEWAAEARSSQLTDTETAYAWGK